MLERLVVENLVVLRAADLEPAPGLTVVTGETGAGKTILIGALGLVLGAKGEAGLVGPHGDAAYAEATFAVGPRDLEDEAFDGLRDLVDDPEEGLTLARRVGADGRSRALAQGRSATRSALDAAGARLVGVVSQHESRRLGRPAVQRGILDAFLGEEQSARLATMADAWRSLVAARAAVAEAEAEQTDLAGRVAELEGIAEQVERVAPRLGEDVELRAERDRLRYADQLAAGTVGAAECLSPEEGEGALELTGRAEREVRAAAERDPSLGALADELQAVRVSLEEASRALHAYAHDVQHDPVRLDEVERRLDLLADLERRHGSLEEAIAAGERARRSLAVARGEEGALDAVRRDLAEAEATASAAAGALADARRAGAGRLASAVRDHLGDLGMADAEVVIEVDERDLGPTGGDEVRMLLAPNPGHRPAPIAEAASGGELSRIALALRVAAHDRDAVPTLVFDEVDAGIGGATAVAVGRKLKDLSATTQVVCITHLAQIAALADRHYRVLKESGDPVTTTIELLDEPGSEAELARMLGGDADAEEARGLARRLREA